MRWVGRGGVEKSRLKLTSAKAEVEVEAELGNTIHIVCGLGVGAK